LGLEAQQSDSSASNSTSLPASSQTEAGTVPRLIKFSGAINPQITQITQVKESEGGKNPLPTVLGVTFSLYELQEGGIPLWSESQNVQVDEKGHYTVLLGATQPEGLPLDLFTTVKALWLGVQPQLPAQAEQPRVLLVAVPYAFKSSDADTLGGLPASAYMLAANQNGVGGSSLTPLIATPAGLPRPDSTGNSVTLGGGTANYVAKFTGANAIGNSVIYSSAGGLVGIGNTNPAGTFDVSGGAFVRGTLHLPATGAATNTSGFNSNTLDLLASSFNSATKAAVPQLFRWQAEPAGNNTTSPSGTLNLLYLSGTGTPAETGLSVAANGRITFASGQTFPGSGTGAITGVTAGTGLTGGGTSGNVTLNLDTTKVPMLAAGSNTFSGSITASSFTGSGVGLTNLTAANLSAGTAGINISGNAATATTAGSAATAGNATNLGGLPSADYARLDIGNSLTGNQSVSGNVSATGSVSGATGNFTGNNTTAILTSAQANSVATLPSNLSLPTAVLGTSTATSDYAAGVTGLTSSPNGFGVMGVAASGFGVVGVTQGTADTSEAISAMSFATTGSAKAFEADVNSPAGVAGEFGASAVGATLIKAEFGPAGSRTSVFLVDTSGNTTLMGNLGVGTQSPAAKLEVNGTAQFDGLVSFASGQTFPGTGTGTITGVTGGTGLTGGGTSGNVTLNVNEGVVAFQSDLTAGITTAETFATNAANTAQTTAVTTAETYAASAASTAQASAVSAAETYANSTFLPVAGGTLTGALGGTTGTFSGALTAAGTVLPATGTATTTQGSPSNPMDLLASSYNSGSSAAVPQLFRWEAEPAANNTTSPSGTLNLLYLSGTGTPAETGLSIAANGQISFASGQTFPGTGTGAITGVTAGTGLTGGGTSGNVTLNVNEGVVAFQSDLTAGITTAETFATGAANTAQTTAVTTAETYAASAASTAQTSAVSAAETYANSTFLPLAGGTLTGTLNLPANGLQVGANQIVTSGGAVGFGGPPGLRFLTDVNGTVAQSNYVASLMAIDGTAQATSSAQAYLRGLQVNPTYDVTAGYANYLTAVEVAPPTAKGSSVAHSVVSFHADGQPETVNGGECAVAFGVLVPNQQTSLCNGTYGFYQSGDAQYNFFNSKVGIGTPFPGQMLEVKGNIKIDGSGNGLTFADGTTQTTAGGGGGITGVTAGTGLTGGGTSGNVTLNLDATKVPTLGAASNVFAGSITASSFSGGGSGLTGVNAATVGGFTASAFQPAGSYATLGANTFTAAQTISSGNVSVSSGDLALPDTASSSVGVVTLGGAPFLHDCCGGSASGDTFLGAGAGNFTTTGSANTASGFFALHVNTSGGENTAIGASALQSNSTGASNTASGVAALNFNSTGADNTASGQAALYRNTTGNGNTASGYDALFSNTTGNQNTAVGIQAGTNPPALTLPTTGSNSTFVGAFATATVDGLTNATAIGYSAQVGESNALVLGGTGGNAVKVGIGTATPAYTLDVQGTGNFTGPVTFAAGQTFPGTGTVTSVSAGSGILVGGTAANPVVSADTSVLATNASVTSAVSGGVTTAETYANNKFLALAGGTLTGGLTGTTATFSGPLTLTSGNLTLPDTAGSGGGVLTLGGVPFLHDCCGNYSYGDTFLGAGAGNFTTTGEWNTASGFQALHSNGNGSWNTASGYQALFTNTAGWANTASGYQALYSNTTAGDNTANGYQALYLNTAGYNNTACGLEALYSNTTGSANTACGVGALGANTTGSQNTAVGGGAGANVQRTLPYTGSNSTFVGAWANATADGLTNATAIGAYAQVSASNALVLGAPAGTVQGTPSGAGTETITANTNVGIDVASPGNIFTVLQGGGHAIADGWDTYSSRRWKTDIQPLRGALGKVERLRGVSYTYTANGKHDIGMIAEEVGKVVPEVVSYEENGKDASGIDYARLTAVLVEAVKQQQTEIQQEKAEIRRLEVKVRRLEASKGEAVRPVAKPAKTAAVKART
jgi:hypothetical protein